MFHTAPWPASGADPLASMPGEEDNVCLAKTLVISLPLWSWEAPMEVPGSLPWDITDPLLPI